MNTPALAHPALAHPALAQPALAHSNDDWAPRLIEFNLHVARFAHRGWYPDALRDVLFDTRGHIDARVEPKVSEWLLREFGLQHETDWQMEEPLKRLWLLDAPSLERLARELAVAMHRDWLARVIDGARVRFLEGRLDRQLWRFVVEEVPEGLLQQRSPTVDFAGSTPQELDATLQDDGARALLALLQPAWRAVRARAQLCFDPIVVRSRVPAFAAARCEQALELICAHLIPKRLPQWAWLF